MESAGKTTTELEKKLKLSVLEAQFYKACNAVRYQGIEIEHTRSCLIGEQLELCEKRNTAMKKELEELKVRC